MEKRPFLWVCLGEDGEWLSFLDPGSRVGITDDALLDDLLVSGCQFGELVPVNVNFIGKCHVVVEENSGFGYSNGKGKSKSKSKSPDGRKKGGGGAVEDGGSGSLPDQFMSEMYQHFANRTSPGGERWSRRHRRKEKERHGRMKWETEHFVKIVNCSPTPSRPLQGLWKVVYLYYFMNIFCVHWSMCSALISFLTCSVYNNLFMFVLTILPTYWLNVLF